MITITNPPPKPAGVKRIFSTGDVHLLHRRVPTWHIVNVLKETLVKFENTIDAIYIAGDLFDDSRHLRQEDSQEAIGFLTWLLFWAKSTNTAIRVLEGTPSHDHKQSKIVEELNSAVGADCLYLDKIGVFYDEALDATIGWVQDEYKALGSETIDATATEKEMAELLATRGIEQMDFCFMHGCFQFQVPVESTRFFHTDFWEPLVKHLIIIHHDHRRKQLGKIRVPGSPDRLVMGEEEDKGFAIVDFTPELARDYFLVNERACPQIKIAAEEDYESQYAKCLKALEYIDTHPSYEIGRLEIEYYPDSPLASAITKWKSQYSFHISGTRIRTPEEEQVLAAGFALDAEVEETISEENVESIMLEALVPFKYDTQIVTDIIRSIK